jgi:uncharacterized membrane protein
MSRLRARVVLGIGLGGFVDGIVLHQIAQWHNMGSAFLPPTTMQAMSRNMRWDGLFHAATWVITVIGVYMLRSKRRQAADDSVIGFTGQMIFGWGAPLTLSKASSIITYSSCTTSATYRSTYPYTIGRSCSWPASVSSHRDGR